MEIIQSRNDGHEVQVFLDDGPLKNKPIHGIKSKRPKNTLTGILKRLHADSAATMLTPEQEAYILRQAYIPEHVFGLMTNLSGGEPFLIDDHFCCRRGEWVIFVGYPFQSGFTPDKFEGVLQKLKKKFKPERISLIAPELPCKLVSLCRDKDSDYYYTLDTRYPVISATVKRNLTKAGRLLTIERASTMGKAHHELMLEFVQRANPVERVRKLFLKMPKFVAATQSSFVLNAWDPNYKLAAFYVIDLAAKDFANYIIGCYSKKYYVRGASDLLLFELISLSEENHKGFIHLGLGVNSGIRRFKEKWGARPTRRYEMCELAFKRSPIQEIVRTFRRLGA